jgi:methylmalonyl-CoA/ethylmalonyl-CoA epimerase
MSKKLAHIGIAVESLDDWIPYYRDVLGLELLGIEEVAEQKVKVAFLKLGEGAIELLEPTSDDSPISKFLQSRGGGIHHLAIQVDSIEDELDRHRDASARLIDSEPRNGAHNMKVAFIHPKTTGGVLVELCQDSE